MVTPDPDHSSRECLTHILQAQYYQPFCCQAGIAACCLHHHIQPLAHATSRNSGRHLVAPCCYHTQPVGRTWRISLPTVRRECRRAVTRAQQHLSVIHHLAVHVMAVLVYSSFLSSHQGKTTLSTSTIQHRLPNCSLYLTTVTRGQSIGQKDAKHPCVNMHVLMVSGNAVCVRPVCIFVALRLL